NREAVLGATVEESAICFLLGSAGIALHAVSAHSIGKVRYEIAIEDVHDHRLLLAFRQGTCARRYFAAHRHRQADGSAASLLHAESRLCGAGEAAEGLF